jgi:hypothetical protein
MYVAGTSDSQFDRTMMGQHGNGNTLIGVQGQNIPSQSQLPTSEQLALVQSAGKRHRSRRHRSRKSRSRRHRSRKSRSRKSRSRKNRKGGFLGAVVSQAAVPFSLLGMQQTYKPKRHHKSKSRRR